MLRRSSPFLVLGLITTVAACDNLTGLGSSSGTPVSIVLMDARTKGAGYTTYPRVNFYSVGAATFGGIAGASGCFRDGLGSIK